ncbi:MAG: transposase [Candidatus Yanofskybacteria bacterium]|nr:transposase [Candidatus Yanofskybacteria bacterium]
MHKEYFTNGEFYHVYNRGNNKRKIFLDQRDFKRFFQSIREFNSEEPIGSIYLNSFKDASLRSSTSKLVDFVCFCLNPNHYHFILKQLKERGIEKFLHRLGTGYTKYFNEKHKCSGSLFQGRYKAIHLNSNEYLLHLSAYVNLNYEVHQLRSSTYQCDYKSSWAEYQNNLVESICNKDIVLSQFRNFDKYREFAVNAIQISRTKKDMEKLLLEEV